MQAGQKFCPECGAPVAEKPLPVLTESATGPKDHTVAVFLLMLGAVVAVIVVLVLMFQTPHATFEGNLANTGGSGNSGNTTYNGQGAVTTSCISAWDEMVGNYAHPYVPTNTYALYNYNAGGDACYNVIHGRQHLSILLLIVAVALGVGVILLYRADNKVFRRMYEKFRNPPIKSEKG